MQFDTGVCAKAYDVAGVGRYLRFVKDQAEHDGLRVYRLHFPTIMFMVSRTLRQAGSAYKPRN